MRAYNQIYEVASENYGLMTTDMARKIGVSSMALVMLEKRGRIIRVGRGVYRLEQFSPTTCDEVFNGHELPASKTSNRSRGVFENRAG